MSANRRRGHVGAAINETDDLKKSARDQRRTKTKNAKKNVRVQRERTSVGTFHCKPHRARFWAMPSGYLGSGWMTIRKMAGN